MIARIHQAEQHRTTVPGVAAITLVSNHHFPRHAHDQFGIGVIACGAQRSWSGLGHVDATAGDVIMCNPGEIHDGVPVAGQVRGWRMIYCEPALVTRELEGETAGPIELIRPVAHDPRLVEQFTRLFACLTASPSDYLATEESLLCSLMYVLRHHGLARSSFSALSPPIAQAVERLDAAPELTVSLAELAALAGVSRFQLVRGFARELGITPHAYLMQRRVRLAQRYLADGQPLAQAAASAGFADQSHMTRAFVRQLGVTPRRYQAAIA